MQYLAWMTDKLWAFGPAQNVIGGFLQSFKQYPPSQPAGGTSVQQALEHIQAAAAGGGR